MEQAVGAQAFVCCGVVLAAEQTDKKRLAKQEGLEGHPFSLPEKQLLCWLGRAEAGLHPGLHIQTATQSTRCSPGGTDEAITGDRDHFPSSFSTVFHALLLTQDLKQTNKQKFLSKYGHRGQLGSVTLTRLVSR